ncbi:hypothetical protein CCC_00654 [Paramagnetospirillum magnetotacticum MS-1]|uniref:Uncharacterized protein n=1 Tax=Paramagnetospirillum magnetotacticum MS-1 TaxID=272627 RepID=A0A0C2YR59_PARME|nr:hypothetical protein CCC_00654 [Paramagnetospirillum magnetotacticum MS-1]
MTLLGIVVLAGSGLCVMMDPVGWIGLAAAGVILVLGRGISEYYRKKLADDSAATARPSPMAYWTAVTLAGSGWLTVVTAVYDFVDSVLMSKNFERRLADMDYVLPLLATLLMGIGLIRLGGWLSRRSGAKPNSPSQN